MIKNEKDTAGRDNTIVRFKPKTKDIGEMTADEILDHLSGRFKGKIVVLALDEYQLLELNTNATVERVNWMLDRAKKLLLKGE